MSDRIHKISVDMAASIALIEDLEDQLHTAQQDAILLQGALQLLLDNDIMPSSGELLAACEKAKALQQFKESHDQLEKSRREWRAMATRLAWAVMDGDDPIYGLTIKNEALNRFQELEAATTL